MKPVAETKYKNSKKKESWQFLIIYHLKVFYFISTLKMKDKQHFWILIGPTILCLVLTKFFWVSYEDDKISIEKTTISKIEAIARTLVYQIDGDAHEALAQSYLEKDAFDSASAPSLFRELVNPLKFAYATNHLETHIYTLRLVDSARTQIQNSPTTYRKIGTEYILMSAPEPYFRHQLPYWPIMENAFFKQEVVNVPIYTDSTGGGAVGFHIGSYHRL